MLVSHGSQNSTSSGLSQSYVCHKVCSTPQVAVAAAVAVAVAAVVVAVQVEELGELNKLYKIRVCNAKCLTNLRQIINHSF